MRDKRDIIIVILIVVIFAGGGYFLGVKNRNNRDMGHAESSTTKKDVTSTTSTKKSESTTSSTSSIYESSTQTQSTEPSLSQEEIAFNKMVSLQGKWGVPSTDSFLMIHEDGSWSATTVGLSEPRQLDVQIDSYNAMSDTLYITIGGEAAQIHVITKDHIIIDYNDGTPPTDYILVS